MRVSAHVCVHACHHTVVPAGSSSRLSSASPPDSPECHASSRELRPGAKSTSCLRVQSEEQSEQWVQDITRHSNRVKRQLELEKEMRTLIFDEEFAHLTPEEFVVTHIVPLRAKLVLVGEGFRFGHKGSGSVETLSELGARYGFKAQQVSHVMLDDQKISSTKTRQLIAEGKVFAASVLLGRNHQTEGVVEHGRKLGRKLGSPTANLSRDSEGLLPADGVYAGYLYADGVRYEAAHSVGTNDSIEAVPRLLESHVIGRDDLDLYGKTVICEYVDQVRPWAKFESVDELTDQIARDVAGAKKILEG